MKTTARDFFLQLGTMILLYVGTGALLNLLFRVINVAYPQITRVAGMYYDSYLADNTISLPVATLVVVFPLFVLLSQLLRQSYVSEPARRELPVRKWLTYITLFVAGGIIAGDLITLLYYFLDGQELTSGFLLKVLAVLVVTGAIFGYYLSDLRNRLTNQARMIWIVIATIIVVAALVLGFAVIGTPQTQRQIRYDGQRVLDLQNLQWQIVNYWQAKRVLPTTLDELGDPISGFDLPKDPQTGMAYEYRATGANSFELCATFNLHAEDPRFAHGLVMTQAPGGPNDVNNGSWGHTNGRTCYVRTIDPDRYPPTPKPL